MATKNQWVSCDNLVMEVPFNKSDSFIFCEVKTTLVRNYDKTVEVAAGIVKCLNSHQELVDTLGECLDVLKKVDDETAYRGLSEIVSMVEDTLNKVRS